MDAEIWKDISGYEGLYAISSYGHVMALIGTFGHIPRKIMRPYMPRGYHRIALFKDGEYRRFFVHRLVASHFIGPLPIGGQVNHIDGNKSNNRGDNLEYVTPKENTAHAFRNGLRHPPVGERNSSTKLRSDQVMDIRRLYALGGHSYSTLGEMFNVSFSNIKSIINNETWRHLLVKECV